MKKILIVEDEQYMQELLQIQLKREYDLTLIDNGADALQFVKKETFDLILLDIMLPYVNGFEICKEIRQTCTVPILMVTARTDIQDAIKGLELGADDYVTKPFDFEELKARMKSLLRRVSFHETTQTKSNILTFHQDMLIINVDNRTVQFEGLFVELTSKEFQLLALLAQSPERVFTREKLLEVLWDYTDERELRAIDSHVKNIRTKFKKIREDTKIIQTVWGMGYQIIIPEVNYEEK